LHLHQVFAQVLQAVVQVVALTGFETPPQL